MWICHPRIAPFFLITTEDAHYVRNFQLPVIRLTHRERSIGFLEYMMGNITTCGERTRSTKIVFLRTSYPLLKIPEET